MTMFNPPHPGEFIRLTYLEPFGISVRFVAGHLRVSPSTFNRLVNGDSSVSPDMAKRLAIALGRSPASWLAMQALYDLHMTKEPRLKKIDFRSYGLRSD